MGTFEVWAPGRGRVEVAVDGRRLPMHRREEGWWESRPVEAPAGARYAFALDGGPVRPDPRSASQPEGVLALSEIVDHRSHQWSDTTWRGLRLRDLVLYEMHIGTFSASGTFDGALAHLPHLATLGVNAVELMPVAEFSGRRGWGYDGVDLFAPHHAYGGPAALKRFVDSCHAAGLGVVLDVVYNHLGPVGNFLAEFGPYFSDEHDTAWGKGLNFDGPSCAEVRRFVIDNAVMWVRDYHVDGLRLDAVQAIVDRSPVHILDELARAVRAAGEELGRGTLVIAESAVNDQRLVRDRSAGGYGLDAAWADDWHHALHSVLTGERTGYYRRFGSFEQLAGALRHVWVRGRLPADVPADRFVVSVQNHDQVGNRAAGERLGAVVRTGRLQIAAALLLTSPATPLLFQGEEWAASTPFQYFTDHADPGVAGAVSSGRRREFAAFGWKPEDVPDPQDQATFERSKLRWDEVGRPPHTEMLDWYRRLLRLRRTLPSSPAAVGSEVEVDADPVLRRLAFRRPGLEVYVNLGDRDWSLPGPPEGRLVMASSGHGDVVPPDAVAIFALDRHE